MKKRKPWLKAAADALRTCMAANRLATSRPHEFQGCEVLGRERGRLVSLEGFSFAFRAKNEESRDMRNWCLRSQLRVLEHPRTQRLRSPEPAVVKRATLERSDLKSENIGLPVELRMPS